MITLMKFYDNKINTSLHVFFIMTTEQQKNFDLKKSQNVAVLDRNEELFRF